MQVQSLVWEDALEVEMATHSNILAVNRGDWWDTVHGVKKELDMTEREHAHNRWLWDVRA